MGALSNIKKTEHSRLERNVHPLVAVMALLSAWRQTWRARRRLHRRISLWYHPGYRAACLRGTARVPHIDLERGERVLGWLAEQHLIRAGDVRSAPSVTLGDLGRVHSRSYLDHVTHAEALGRILGLEPDQIDVDCVLSAQRRAAGGTIAAARWAISGTARIGFNLGGGFHHAEPENGSGFCVFNDIATAIRVLRVQGFAGRIAIVDTDFHQGNGNIVTFADDLTVATYSIHGSAWTHVQAVADRQVLLDSGCDDARYHSALTATLLPFLDEHRPELMFYIAGNDVLAGDPLGGFALTAQGVLARDCLVLEAARARVCPIVVTLGGGYTAEAWQGTARLIAWALTDANPPAGLTDQSDVFRRRFDEAAQRLEPSELRGDPTGWDLTEADLMSDLAGVETRLLGYYSANGIELALEHYGVLDKLRSKGYSDLRVRVDPRDREHQRLIVDGRRDRRWHTLVDATVRLVSSSLPLETDSPPLNLLSIEWMQLQDPGKSFSLHEPPLPGQAHPGLGILAEVIEVLRQACLRLGLDGVVIHPAHYHVAKLGAADGWFLDPAVQGRFDALCATLAPYELSHASQLVELGRVRERTGSPLPWVPAEFVAPVSARLRDYFASADYTAIRWNADAEIRPLTVDVEELAATGSHQPPIVRTSTSSGGASANENGG